MYKLTNINECTFSLKITGEHSQILYKSILNIIPSSQYNSQSKSIYFNAENVYILKHKFKKCPLSKCVELIDTISKQIMILKELGYGFYGINMEDILTIDNIYIICDSTRLLPIINNNFNFIHLFEKPYFSNPEVEKLTILPTQISYKCSFYSLGMLVIYCLFEKHLFIEDDVYKNIESLNNTKIYWFIKRCLDSDIHKRRILLI
jgi:hypothetical protein